MAVLSWSFFQELMHLDAKSDLTGFPVWWIVAEICLCCGLAMKPWASGEEQVVRRQGAKGIPGEETSALSQVPLALGEQ